MTALLKPTGSPTERFTSRNPDDFPTPNRSQENWRFSPLARLRAFFEPFEPDGVIEGDQSVPVGAHVDVVDPTTLDAFGRALTPADRVSALAMAGACAGARGGVARPVGPRPGAGGADRPVPERHQRTFLRPPCR